MKFNAILVLVLLHVGLAARLKTRSLSQKDSLEDTSGWVQDVTDFNCSVSCTPQCTSQCGGCSGQEVCKDCAAKNSCTPCFDCMTHAAAMMQESIAELPPTDATPATDDTAKSTTQSWVQDVSAMNCSQVCSANCMEQCGSCSGEEGCKKCATDHGCMGCFDCMDGSTSSHVMALAAESQPTTDVSMAPVDSALSAAPTPDYGAYPPSQDYAEKVAVAGCTNICMDDGEDCISGWNLYCGDCLAGDACRACAAEHACSSCFACMTGGPTATTTDAVPPVEATTLTTTTATAKSHAVATTTAHKVSTTVTSTVMTESSPAHVAAPVPESTGQLHATGGAATSMDPPPPPPAGSSLPRGWKSKVDPTTGHTYYFNKNKVAQWVRPGEHSHHSLDDGAEDDSYYYQDENDDGSDEFDDSSD